MHASNGFSWISPMYGGLVFHGPSSSFKPLACRLSHTFSSPAPTAMRITAGLTIEKVRHGCKQQFQNSMKLLCMIVFPCFAAECLYKLWWYVSGATELPYYGNIYLSNTILCTLELCSWLYRTTIFFLVCVLFRLICRLQILRPENFAQVFQKETEVELILMEHLKIRRNLWLMSHRFRVFILLSLIMVTASQLISLVMVTRSSAHINIFKAGELALCSISLVISLFICLRSATKITHKAQSITGLAAKWHVCATIQCFYYTESETPMAPISSAQVFPFGADIESEDDEAGEDHDLDNTKLVPIYTHTISFQKRQALVCSRNRSSSSVTVLNLFIYLCFCFFLFFCNDSAWSLLQ
ncbi:uncharacterized protein Pyn_30337 [Prunus yedoensis var. nudiflora]|uniref:Uncharacterized protein n=1 Tax=Prunus yedoensis var. nudiflora TaxID=2094558 RepID=A0A314XII9_PRUYE|nr:uncharacterized protein Pyn_30337 [Prunus yedoensis var. nudiflora]